MEYSTNNNGNYNNNLNRVSTSGITLFDDNGIMLKLSYLGDTLSLIMGEPVEVDGKRTYPDDKRQAFLITPERATVLYEAIALEGVVEALKENQNYCSGIFLNKGKSSVLQLRVQDNEIYLVYCKNINENRISEQSYVFHFNKIDVINEYDPKTGTFDSQGKVEGTFFLFCKYLDAGVNGLHNAMAHSVRKVNQAATTKIFNYLSSIAAKLGVTIDDSYGPNRPSGPAPTSGFMNPSTDDEEIPFSMESSSSSSLDDILN